MEIPCKDCITLSICKQRLNDIDTYSNYTLICSSVELLDCPLVKEYINANFVNRNIKSCDINKLHEVVNYIYER